MNPEILTQLNRAAESIVAAGWLQFIQVAVLAGVLAMVELAFGRRLDYPWRCALWLLFFIKLVLPPQLALPTSPAYWWPNRDTVTAGETGADPGSPTIAPANEPWLTEPSNVVPKPAPNAAAHPNASLSWSLLVVLVWLVGMMTIAVLTIIRHRRLARTLRRSEPAPASLQLAVVRAAERIGLRARVALRVVDASTGPLVTGCRHPTIHLPRALADRLTVDQLHAVLVHELYHVKRGDLWVAAVQSVARVFFFHHPAVWWVNRHLARLREEATDRAVLAHRDIGRRAYSLALVEAAACIAHIPPPSALALGVIETQSQLQKRIAMNLVQPRSGRVRLGLPGLFSLVVLAFVFVPMMPAGSAEPAARSPAGFQSVDAAPLLRRIEDATATILDAFNRRDRDAYLAAFTSDPLVLPEGGGLATSLNGIRQMYLQAPTGLVYEPMVWADREVYQLDRWVIDTGLVAFRFRLTPDAPVMRDPRQAFTIWEAGDDGELRVKLLAWNKLADPQALAHETEAKAFVLPDARGPFTRSGNFSDVLAAEDAFHHAFEVRDLKQATAFYDEGARLIPPRNLPLHGRTAIISYLETLAPDQVATKIEREVAYVEGNADHVLVVNLFRWTFAVSDARVPVAVAGKGVHLWQRGADGRWRILFDLPNTSQPTT